MIQFICFSKDRPLQLHGYLASLFKFIDEPTNITTTVIAKASTLGYQDAYDAIAKEFPQVKFVWEKNFHEDLMASFNDNPYVCFGCDDVVFYVPIRTKQILEVFDENTFAFSMRLGHNVENSMFSGKMQTPTFILDETGDIIAWDLHKSHHCADWGYSWELNGTVYPTDIAKQVVEELKANSPNILENSGGGRWSCKTKRNLMKSWSYSRLVVPTVNVVQTNFANSICGSKELSPEFLLQCWNSGLRIDVEAFARHEYNSVHIPNFYMHRI